MNRHGFTLVEVMVALTVAAVLAAMARVAVSTLIELSERAAERRDQAATAAAVRSQISRWVEAAFVDPDRGDGGFEGIAKVSPTGAPDDSLLFLTRVGSMLTTDGLEPVRISIWIQRAEGSAAGTLVAELRRVASRRHPGAGDAGLRGDEAVERAVLATHVTGLSVRYLFASGDDRLQLTSWSSVIRLPEAVEVRIHGDSVPPVLRVPITVPLAMGG